MYARGCKLIPTLASYTFISLRTLAHTIHLHYVTSDTLAYTCIRVTHTHDTCISLHTLLHILAYAFISLYTLAFVCIYLHQLAYACIRLSMLAYACTGLHTLAYACIRLPLLICLHTLAYDYLCWMLAYGFLSLYACIRSDT